MAAQDAVTSVRGALARLDTAVGALRLEYGDTLGTRRLTSDLRRLAEDLTELGGPAAGHRRPPSPAEEIPDAPYDRGTWTDAEDEGFGAPDRRAP